MNISCIGFICHTALSGHAVTISIRMLRNLIVHYRINELSSDLLGTVQDRIIILVTVSGTNFTLVLSNKNNNRNLIYFYYSLFKKKKQLLLIVLI